MLSLGVTTDVAKKHGFRSGLRIKIKQLLIGGRVSIWPLHAQILSPRLRWRLVDNLADQYSGGFVLEGESLPNALKQHGVTHFLKNQLENVCLLSRLSPLSAHLGLHQRQGDTNNHANHQDQIDAGFSCQTRAIGRTEPLVLPEGSTGQQQDQSVKCRTLGSEGESGPNAGDQQQPGAWDFLIDENRVEHANGKDAGNQPQNQAAPTQLPTGELAIQKQRTS